MSSSSEARPADGIATWKVEAFVAACLVIIGAVIAYQSWKLGAGWREDGPGAGYFPFYIGVLIVIASATILGGAVLGSKRNTEAFVTNAQLKLVLTVLWPTIAFVVVTQLIGIYIGSLLFIAGFMVVIGHYSWSKSVLIALIVAALCFLLFEIWFKVPLYKGIFNPLSFLGY
jgi:hypothetical protein